MSAPPDSAIFFGRFHPLLVHLPIGFLLLLAALETISRWPQFRNASHANGYILAFTVPATLLAAACGWVLALGADYDPQLLRWHRWSGVGTALATVLVALLYALGQQTLYRWVLMLTVAALTVASHFGGSLTHGRDYLTRHAPGPLRLWLGGERQPASSGLAGAPPAGVSAKKVFAEVVQPMLNQYCVGCHGPEKQKAGLRLDSLEGMKKGAHGPVFVPGDSAKSLLIQVMTLPRTDDRHMPPEGKPQPIADDLKLLTWWIDAGAATDRTLGELNPPPDIRRLLESRLGGPEPAAKVVPPKPLSEVLLAGERTADELGIAVSALAEDEPWLQVNASIAGRRFGDAALARLVPFASHIRWLDLAGTGVTDRGLATVAAVRNLVRLHLDVVCTWNPGRLGYWRRLPLEE